MIRWDSALARALAEELHTLMRGWRVRAMLLDGDRGYVAIHLKEGTLLWHLRPAEGACPALVAPREPGPGALPLPMRVRGVTAPADERMLVVELVPLRSGHRAANVVFELMGTHLNCLVVEVRSGTIRHALRTTTKPRRLARGLPYTPPRPRPREGVDGLSPARFEAATRADRKSLVEHLAWVSPINEQALRRLRAEEGAPAAYKLWLSLAGKATPASAASPSPAPAVEQTSDRPPEPVDSGRTRFAPEGKRSEAASAPRTSRPVLIDGRQPYPFALPGAAAKPIPSLIDGFNALTAGLGSGSGRDRAQGPVSSDPILMERLEQARNRIERRLASVRRRLGELKDPADLRALGHLILARYHEIPAGAARAEIVDLEGGSLTVSLVPGRDPWVSAQRYFTEASKAERAAARLPELIDEAESRLARFDELAARLREGTLTEEEVAASLSSTHEHPHRRRAGGGTGSAHGVGGSGSLPYRSYRSTAGSEIRVGLGARRNDDLTFRHSSPGDIWCHARHAAGAHVILRWPARGGNPSRSELYEAAVLAAVHSKARHASLAPVDWTRRRYVRKPSGSPPGAVIAERVGTIFVRPDEELARGLAIGSSPDLPDDRI